MSLKDIFNALLKVKTKHIKLKPIHPSHAKKLHAFMTGTFKTSPEYRIPIKIYTSHDRQQIQVPLMC